jgi:hypothetical protein
MIAGMSSAKQSSAMRNTRRLGRVIDPAGEASIAQGAVTASILNAGAGGYKIGSG